MEEELEQKDLIDTSNLQETLEETKEEMQSLANSGVDLSQRKEDGSIEQHQEVLNRVRGVTEEEGGIKAQEAINPEVVEPDAPPNAFNKSIFATTPLAIPTAVGLGTLDFGIDVATKLTGAEELDNKWDRITKFDNPWTQRLRNFASVAIPTFVPVVGWSRYVQALRLPALTNAVAHIGGAAAIDAAVIGFSDMGEEENTARILADTFPQTFGPQGHLPIPEDWKVLDGDSLAVRRQKNMLESTVISGAADVLAYTVTGAKPIMHWFKAKDADAKVFKETIEMAEADKETIKEIARLRQEIATTKGMKKGRRKVLEIQIENLTKQMRATGYSEATTVPAEAFVKKQADNRLKQIDEVAFQRLQELPPPVPGKPRDYDPWITPGLANKAENAVNTVPPGAEARNAFEVALKKQNGMEGDPTPMLTTPFLKNAIKLDPAEREIMDKLTWGFKRAGDYVGMIGTIRKARREMDDAAWEIYRDIIAPGTSDDLRKLFPDSKKSEIAFGNVSPKIKYLNETDQIAVSKAIKDLSRLYLGKEVTETSARLMDTLGHEITSHASASLAYKELVDDKRIQEMVLDKLEFLTTEYGLHKYIKGWGLRNIRWWQFWKEPEKFAATFKELSEVRRTKLESFKKLRSELDRLSEVEPLMMRPLMEAFAYSDGDVITLSKLVEYAKKEVSMWGMIKSSDPHRMNKFAKGAWAVMYGNTLSGLSGLRAAVGNGSKLILKPMESFLGHGIQSIKAGSWDPIRKSLYYHASFVDTTRRALSDAVKRMKMVHNDPEFMMKALREDYRIDQDDSWRILDDIAKNKWEKDIDNNWGSLYQYRWAKASRDVSKMKWMRTGTTFMSGVDAFTDTFMATAVARARAYDDVLTKEGLTFSKVGKTFDQKLADAERKHYAKVWGKDELLSDEYVKNASGEIALNLEDDVATYINKATTALPAAKHLFMFPRTSLNMAKMASSYMPLQGIPGLNKYTAVLQAGNDITKIKDAMALHGIKNCDQSPNAMAMFKNLEAEYAGRIALGQMTMLGFFTWAVGTGNVRGNGPVNASERKKLMDKGWRPKTINVGGNWVSYAGIPMLDTTLALVGDLVYYMNDLGSSLTQNWLDKLVWTLSATYLNNTPLYGLEPLTAAMNGDQSAFNRILANLARGAIPASGALGVVSNAITSSQKDIYNDFLGYVGNRVPIWSSTLPERIDFWSGRPINDIDNPILRFMNALSPVKVSGGDEPWRQWLFDTGFDGYSVISQTSVGRQQLDAHQREKISRYIGEQQLWKLVEEASKNPHFNDEMAALQELRRRGFSQEDIQLKAELTDTYRYLRAILNNAKAVAEQRLVNETPTLQIGIEGQTVVDNLLRQGDPKEAAKYGKQYQNQINQQRNFLNFHRK